MTTQTTLPDPNNRISIAGNTTSGSFGPGFSSVTLKSNQPVVSNKSNSGLSFRSIVKYHQWELDIKYNDLTKADFNIVYPFLLERQQTQEAFFVELPQYGNAVAATQQVNTSSSLGAGRNQIPLIGTGINNIKMGDMFDLINSNDSLHLKAYKVTKVNTTTNTIFFSPGLQRRCANGDTVTASFTRPRIRVRVKGAMLTYQVKANGLYTFSVNVEEALA